MTLPPLWAALAGVFVGLAAATFAGWALVRRFAEGLTGRERLAWGLATGLLLQAALLLLLLTLGSTPTAARLLSLEIVIAGAGLLIGRRRRRSAPGWIPSRRRDPLALALGAVAGAAWLLFLLTALADAPWATDFLAIWGLKAKLISLTSSVPRRLFADPALAFDNPEYPLLVPVSLAALSGISGSWNDQALPLFDGACAGAALLALSGSLSRRVSPAAGATGAALAALCFPLYGPSSVGTAEIALALGMVLAATAAIDFAEAESGAAWRLAAASLFLATTKQEGTLFAALLSIVLAARVRRVSGRRSAVALAALLIPPAVHAALLAALRGPLGSRAFDLTLLRPERWSGLAGRFAAVASHLLTTRVLPSWAALLAIGVYFAATRRGAGDWLVPVFAAQLLGYALGFAMSAFGPLWAADSAFGRITMTLFPALALVLAARLPGRPSTPEPRASRLSLVRPPVEPAPGDAGGGGKLRAFRPVRG